jgi:hypothetical protein
MHITLLRERASHRRLPAVWSPSGRATTVPFTPDTTGPKRTAKDNTTAATTCTFAPSPASAPARSGFGSRRSFSPRPASASPCPAGGRSGHLSPRTERSEATRPNETEPPFEVEVQRSACQRFARTSAARNLAAHHGAAFRSAAHLRGCGVAASTARSGVVAALSFTPQRSQVRNLSRPPQTVDLALFSAGPVPGSPCWSPVEQGSRSRSRAGGSVLVHQRWMIHALAAVQMWRRGASGDTTSSPPSSPSRSPTRTTASRVAPVGRQR